MSHYQLINGKSCHLPVEHEQKSMWTLKKLNLNWSKTSNLRIDQLNEMYEFQVRAYESSALYKEMMKMYHNQMIERESLV